MMIRAVGVEYALAKKCCIHRTCFAKIIKNTVHFRILNNLPFKGLRFDYLNPIKTVSLKRFCVTPCKIRELCIYLILQCEYCIGFECRFCGIWTKKSKAFALLLNSRPICTRFRGQRNSRLDQSSQDFDRVVRVVCSTLSVVFRN